MMFPNPLHFPLYFDESEVDLWLALQRIEPVERGAFIKATLRQVLLGENCTEGILEDMPLGDALKKNNECDQTNYYFDTLEENIESFSLEALFTGASEPDMEYEGFFEHEKTQVDSQREPWDYLLNSVIGEEEDIAVINSILQAPCTSKEKVDQCDNIPRNMNSPQLQVEEVNALGELEGQLDIMRDQGLEIDFESLKVDLPKPLTGFEYLIKNIIGTEENEAILQVLRGRDEKHISTNNK